MKVKTKTAGKQIWQSPDGQKTIWQVTVYDEQDKAYGLQTFSEAIAKEGFAGEVETYAKGDKRYVKQVQSEAGYKAGGNNAARAKADADKQSEIKAEWAINQAIKALQIFPLDDEALKQVEELAIKLNAMVNRIKYTNGGNNV